MILIVERNRRNCELVADLFSKHGLETEIACTLEALDEHLKNSHNIKLVVMDIVGFDRALWERSEKMRRERIPFIIISSRIAPGRKLPSLGMGERAFLSKPVVVKELLTIAESILKEPVASRILLMLDQKENSRLLAELLAESYAVKTADNDEAIEGAYDLCILDGIAMERLWERVRKRKEDEEPVALPFLVTTTRTDAQLVKRRLWQAIDDLIQTPVDKRELLAQAEILLRARKLSFESIWCYDALARNIPGAVFISQDDLLVYANPIGRQMGIPREGRSTLSFVELFHPEDRGKLIECSQKAMREGRATCEARYSYDDNLTRYADVRLVSIRHGRKPAILGTALDITAQKAAAIELEKYQNHLEELVKERSMKLDESRQHLKTILENMTEEVWFYDEKGNLTMVNEAARKAFGLEDLNA